MANVILNNNLNDNKLNIEKLINEYSNSISPFYVAILESENCYQITTNKNLTKLENGYSMKIAIPSISTNDVTIKIDNMSPINVKNNKGKNVNNFNVNGVYNLTYYNGNFILVGGSSVEYDETTVENKFVLNDSKFINKSGNIEQGTMINNNEYKYANKISDTNDYYALGQSNGYYPSSSNGWAPEIRVIKNDFNKYIGLESWKIRSDQNIAGVQGTLTKYNNYNQAVSIVCDNNTMYVRIFNGCYPDNTGVGYPEITIPRDWLINALGITSDKIAKGQSIAGVEGQ